MMAAHGTATGRVPVAGGGREADSVTVTGTAAPPVSETRPVTAVPPTTEPGVTEIELRGGASWPCPNNIGQTPPKMLRQSASVIRGFHFIMSPSLKGYSPRK